MPMRPPPPSATTESPSDHFSGDELDKWDFSDADNQPQLPTNRYPGESSSKADVSASPEPSAQSAQPSPLPAPPADDSWDPLEGWDPNAPLDTSTPVGSPTIPPPASPQPIGEIATQTPPPPPPTNESIRHDGAGASAADSSDRIAPADQPNGQAPPPAMTGDSPALGNGVIDGAIDTNRVITMAVLGGLGLLLFLVLLMVMF